MSIISNINSLYKGNGDYREKNSAWMRLFKVAMNQAKETPYPHFRVEWWMQDLNIKSGVFRDTDYYDLLVIINPYYEKAVIPLPVFLEYVTREELLSFDIPEYDKKKRSEWFYCNLERYTRQKELEERAQQNIIPDTMEWRLSVWEDNENLIVIAGSREKIVFWKENYNPIGEGGLVHIEVYKGGKMEKSLTYKMQNEGKYVWHLPIKPIAGLYEFFAKIAKEWHLNLIISCESSNVYFWNSLETSRIDAEHQFGNI